MLSGKNIQLENHYTSCGRKNEACILIEHSRSETSFWRLQIPRHALYNDPKMRRVCSATDIQIVLSLFDLSHFLMNKTFIFSKKKLYKSLNKRNVWADLVNKDKYIWFFIMQYNCKGLRLNIRSKCRTKFDTKGSDC